ncbi:helix-turn-helix domain-containing protein [Larkinella soli]|uniref:helix-turn-helix domain-containing protein n=1 Tax=Larkinella soli TaxID=1770527 RepID=UPI0013E32D57|nr:helix-turn-helix transcriptional regulator [Larkinella soli]
MEPDIDIAVLLRKIRTRHGYSLESVATALGKSTEGYRKYEAGKTDPTFNTLKQLAGFYGVSVLQLLAFD